MLPKGLLKEHANAISMLTRFIDMGIAFFSGVLAYHLKFAGSFFKAPSFVIATLIGVLSTSLVFTFLKIYRSSRGKQLLGQFFALVHALVIAMLVMAGLAYLTKSGPSYSRIWFGLWMSITFCTLIIFRLTLLLVLRLMRSQGLNERRVVIMGAGKLGQKFAETVQEALWTGFRIVAFIDDEASNKPALINDIPVTQTPNALGEYLTSESIDEIWLALPLRAEERVKEILHELRFYTISTRFVLNIFGLDLLNHSVSDLAGFPVLNICGTPMVGVNRLLKAFEDRFFALCILLLISPVFLFVAVLVKFSSKGPIFYRQKRVGWNGKEFEMLKFRTMPQDAEGRTGPVWARRDDNRATPLGKFLRRTSLDELPQFINVLKGDMSIVGPRPERKIFVDEFKQTVPRYMQKHFVKAGITGWAQVNGWRGNTDLKKRVEYDLFYIEHWSLWFDLKIILLTFLRGFINHNAY